MIFFQNRTSPGSVTRSQTQPGSLRAPGRAAHPAAGDVSDVLSLSCVLLVAEPDEALAGAPLGEVRG